MHYYKLKSQNRHIKQTNKQKLIVTNWLISRYTIKIWTLCWLFYSAFLWRNGTKTSSTIRVLKSLINLVFTPPKGCKMVSTCFKCFEYLCTYSPLTSCKIWGKSNGPILIKNPAIIHEQINGTIFDHFDPFLHKQEFSQKLRPRQICVLMVPQLHEKDQGK